MDYDGFFVRGHAVMPVEDFDVATEQDEKSLRSDGGRRKERRYINNFFFFPAEQNGPRPAGASALASVGQIQQ